MARAYLGLGSNVGERLKFLRRAVTCLGEVVGTRVTKVSSVYETEPVGVTDQGWFLNAVVEVDTMLSAEALLERTQAIERALGRVRTRRWGPRTIDLDILLYGDLQVKTDSLTIPHPELHRRAFVMIPLLELNPGLSLPDSTAISTCLAQLGRHEQVRPVAPPAALAARSVHTNWQRLSP
jgi:2-amino-4-hydroxy-6-hydroxymethyldihydropteridine diphosphokinase